MFELKSPEGFRIALYFVLPGLITVFFRTQFLAGRMQKHSDAVLTYFAVSVFYWSCLSLFGLSPVSNSVGPFSTFVAMLLAPAILGVALGLNARADVIRKLLRRFGINPVHAITTAWDWKFSRTAPRFVIVTLSDGGGGRRGLCGDVVFFQ